MEIHHLHNHVINKELWDQTISASPNGNIYAWSWYLDAVCPGWQALITDNYGMVMPLTPRRKFGINYLYQPLLSQQAGIFSPGAVTSESVSSFLNSIPQRFKFAEITLNASNSLAGSPFPVTNHKTFLLDLRPSYEEIFRDYSDNTRRNLRKAMDCNPDFQTECHPGDYLDLLKEDKSNGSRILLSAKNRPALIRLLSAIHRNNSGTIQGTINSRGVLIAAVLTGVSHNTIYYLAPAMTAEGRDSRAMFYLIDRMIRAYSGQNYFLDFEGSDIENIARFYSGFGSIPVTYPAIRFNRLSRPLKLLANLRFR